VGADVGAAVGTAEGAADGDAEGELVHASQCAGQSWAMNAAPHPPGVLAIAETHSGGSSPSGHLGTVGAALGADVGEVGIAVGVLVGAEVGDGVNRNIWHALLGKTPGGVTPSAPNGATDAGTATCGVTDESTMPAAI
jgi:hypothetical protein